MAGSDRWYFTKDVLQNTPSRKCGIDSDKELSYRQQAANLIQDMGQRLHVSQLCINTAIVYMHRFYTFHSFTKFHRNSISCCALFLAAKVEEQPRKLEHVIKVSHMCLHRETPALDIKSDTYQEQAMELVFNENLMLQTLGFDVAVEHPHSSVVNCCQLVRASKDLAQTSYFMATNSLHLTTMCLQYKPTVVACVCIHLACKWSSWEIPRSSEGKDWFYYVDKSVTLDLLEQLTSEFLAILDKCPSRLKRKILSGSGGGSGNSSSSSNSNSLAINKSIDEKKNSSNVNKDEVKPSLPSKSSTNQLVSEITTSVNTCQPRRSPPSSPLMKKVKAEPQQSNKIPVAMSYAAYREKKDKERAHIQQDHKQQSEQLNKLNQVNKSSHPIAQQHRDKPIITDKLTAKQQQINIDKQKQSEERHRIKSKTQDNLPIFEGSNRSAYSSKTATSSSAHLKSSQNNNNIISEDFYENLNLNKPSNHLNFNSIFSTDGEDSSDFKKEIATDLKMEFSDNDSNQSTDCLNLTSLPSAFMNDSSDSKTSLPNINLQTSIVETKPTSFTSIFSTPMTSNLTSSSQSKPENVKPSIPSKYNDSLSVLSRIKPEPPPPMLSPLKHDSEMCSKHENQSLLSHSSKFETLTQQHLKSNTNNNPNSDLDSKQFQNSKVSKISPKSRSYTQHKNSSVLSQHSISGLREKEVSDVSQTIKLENSNNTQIETVINNFNINNNLNNIQNSNNTENIPLKQEFKDKNSKPAELPSVSSSKALTTNSNIEFDIKPSIESLAEQKPAFYLCPSPQQNINNVSAVPLDTSVTKTSVTHNKESKEKHSQEHDRHDKHHKHHHRSRKSSKHKDKHKHKHKDKDREKHKRKDKDRDREKHNDVKDDPSFKISFSSPKDKPDLSTNLNIAPIKLKISKKKLSVDEPDKDNDVPQNPLKLRIQLNSKDQKLTANTTPSLTDSNNGSSSRKRRSSPKSSKKEKMSKHELETNIVKSYSSSKTKEEKSNKTSSKSKNATEKDSKKSSNNSFNDEKRSALSQQLQLQSKSNLQTNAFDQQMFNMANTQTTQQHNRSSKAHK